MTKIQKITTNEDVQLHIQKAYDSIEKYLPKYYAEDVLEKLKPKKVSKTILRNVKNKKSIRLDILNAMVEVALENKKQILKLKKLTS